MPEFLTKNAPDSVKMDGGQIVYNDIRDDALMQKRTEGMPEEKFEGTVVWTGGGYRKDQHTRTVMKVRINNGKKGKKSRLTKCFGAFPDMPRNMPVTFMGKRTNDRKIELYAWNLEIGNSYLDDAVEFLASGNFEHFNRPNARKFLERYDGNLFSDSIDDGLEDRIRAALAPTMPEDRKNAYVKAIASFIRQNAQQRECREKMAKYGYRYDSIMYAANKFGDKLDDVIKASPYVMMDECDEPFSLCDHYYLEHGGDPTARTRICHAIISAARRYEMQTGSTYMLLPELICDTQRELSQNGTVYGMEPLCIINEIPRTPGISINKYHNPYGVPTSVRISLKDTAYTEESIARNIMRLNDNRSSLPLTDEIIDFAEKLMGVTLDAEQRGAMKAVTASGVNIIEGLPGTGKTTMIRALVTVYRMMTDGKVWLCAPTGRAAERMTESVGNGMAAATVHKTLNLVPRDGRNLNYGWMVNPRFRNNPTIDGPGLIVLDEATMLDMDIYARLLEAVKTGSTVVLVGDTGQLPSINRGRVFSDLIESGAVPVYRLTMIHRQAGGSVTCRNAQKIREGKADLETDESFEIIRASNSQEAREILKKKLSMVAENPENCQVLSTVKDDPDIGTHAINSMVQKARHGENTAPVDDEGIRLRVDDKVIFQSNNPSEGYMNGDMGLIKGVCSDHITVELFGTKKIVCLPYEDFEDIDLGYAVTVHKSQGSEWDTVIVILPEEYEIMLQRNLVYTAVTRAKRHNIVITVGGALETAISQNDISHRQTMLGERLRELMGQKDEVVDAILAEDSATDIPVIGGDGNTLMQYYMKHNNDVPEQVYKNWLAWTGQTVPEKEAGALVDAVRSAQKTVDMRTLCLAACPRMEWAS